MLMFIISVSFAHMASRAKNRDVMLFFSALAVLIPCVLGGLRAENLGNDTGGYARTDFRLALHSPTFQAFVSNKTTLSHELGYSFITYSLTKLFGVFSINLFAYQLITITCIYIGAYRQRERVPVPFTMLIFLILQYCQTYCLIRQCISASIIFMGLKPLENKKYKTFTLYVFTAMMFHTSALLGLFLFLLFHMMIGSDYIVRKKLFKVFLLAVILSLVPLGMVMMNFMINSLPVLSQYQNYEQYVAEYFSYAAGGILLGTCFMFNLYRKGASKLFEHGKMYQFYNYSLVFNIVYRATLNIFPQRILFYFEFINAFLLASIPFFVREKAQRAIFSIGAVIVALVYYYCIYIIRNDRVGIWPYRSILL